MHIRKLIVLLCVAVWGGCVPLLAQGPLTPVVGPVLPQVIHAGIAVGDYDGDGLEDLFLSGMNSNYQPRTYLLKNDTSNNSFTQVTHPFPDLRNGDADWGDLNGDSIPDIAMIGMGTNRTLITKIFTQDTNGIFHEVSHTIPGLRDGTVNWVDLDGDGDDDLFVTGWNWTQGQYIGCFRNDNSVLKQVHVSVMVPRSKPSVDFGDYDNDGNVDIVIGGGDDQGNGYLEIYRSTGNWSWDSTAYQLDGIREGSVDFGDYDGDGDLDLLTCGSQTDGEIHVYNYSPDNFSKVSYSFPVLSNTIGRWEDYDLDGDEDFVVIGGSYHIPGKMVLTRIYENTGNGTFQSFQTPAGGVRGSGLAWMDYDHDGNSDFITSGISQNGGLQVLIYRFNGTIFEY